MGTLLQDVACFFRSIRKSPGFFGVATLTLALGIGANTAIFSVINSVLLRPLPFHEPDRLVRLFETEAAPGRYPFAGPDYLDWKAQNTTLEAMSLFSWYRRVNVSGGGRPESALSMPVEDNFFRVLGVQPMVGRTFALGESGGGGARVAILSYGFWQSHFGGEEVLDRSIELDSVRYTVIGVMPSWFNYPRDTQVWTPLDMAPTALGNRGSHSYLAVGRVKTGVTLRQVQADLSVVAARLEKQYPNSNEKVGAAVVSMRDQLTSSSREPLLILLGAVALVLLVACANVANLLLIRAGSRRRELAIRAALGASRWRIVRQLLTESVLLALAGAAAGLLAAWWIVGALRALPSPPIPVVNPLQIDGAVLAFTLAAAVVTGILFGILPALLASAVQPGDELKASSQGAGGTAGRARRVRDAVAVAEMALSLALLVGAGLLLRSFERMQHAEIGADARNVLTVGLNLPATKYSTAATRGAFYYGLLERLVSSPGTEAACLSTAIPLEGGSNGYITVPGEDNSRLANQLFEWNHVTAGYFKTFGIALLQGRSFTAADESHAAETTAKIAEIFSQPNPPKDPMKGITWPAVISQSMARIIWGPANPIGRTFERGGMTVEVIGVVADSKVEGIRGDGRPQAFFPFGGSLGDPWGAQFSLRTSAEPMSAVAPLRAQVAALDPSLALVNPRTMDDVIADGMRDTSLQTVLLVSFAAVAALLAAVGLYSVLAFLVAQRRQEIGIRAALGAGQIDLARLVAGHAAKLVTTGLVVGLATAFWLTRLLRGLLFGVEANDAWTFASVSVLLIVVALAACALPARRAMRTDPITVLRSE